MVNEKIEDLTPRNGVIFLDYLGLKCPRPLLKLMAVAPNIPAGNIVEILGDCPSLESDIRNWSKQKNKAVLSVKEEGEGKKRIQVQF